MPTVTWGATSADWFALPSPWVGGTAPGTADTALLQPGTYAVTLAGGETAAIGALTLPLQTSFDVFGGPFNSGQSLAVAAGATLATAQGATLGDGTLVLAGLLTGGLFVPDQPSITGISLPHVYSTPTLQLAGGTIAGGLRIGNAIDLAVSGGTLRLAGGTLDVEGQLTFGGDATIAGAAAHNAGRITGTTLGIRSVPIECGHPGEGAKASQGLRRPRSGAPWNGIHACGWIGRLRLAAHDLDAGAGEAPTSFGTAPS